MVNCKYHIEGEVAQWFSVFFQQWLRYQQGPGFESHLRPVEIFAYNKVSPLNNQTPALTSVPSGLMLSGVSCKTTNKRKQNKTNEIYSHAATPSQNIHCKLSYLTGLVQRLVYL